MCSVGLHVAASIYRYCGEWNRIDAVKRSHDAPSIHVLGWPARGALADSFDRHDVRDGRTTARRGA